MADLHEKTAGAADGLEAGLAHFFNANIPAIRPLIYAPGKKYCYGSAEERETHRAASLDAWIGAVKAGKNIGFDAYDLSADLVPATLDCDSLAAMSLVGETAKEKTPIVQSASGFEHWHFLLTQATFRRLFNGVRLIPDFPLEPEINLELLTGAQHRVMPGSRVRKIKPTAMPGADGLYRFKQAGPLYIDPPSIIALMEELLAALKTASTVRYGDFGGGPADDAEPVKHGTRDNLIRDLAWWMAQDRQIKPEAVIAELELFEQRHIAWSADHVPTAGHIPKKVASALKKIDAWRKSDDERGASYYDLDKGNPIQSFANLLKCGGAELAMNQRELRLEIRRGDEPWRTIKAHEIAELRESLQALCRPRPEINVVKGAVVLPKDSRGETKPVPAPWRIGRDLFNDHANIAGLRNARDPVAERLDQLWRETNGGREFRGEPIADDYLLGGSARQFFLAANRGDPDNEAALNFLDAIIGCGIVIRALKPGAHWAFTPALIGPVGIGKSMYGECWTFNPEVEFSDSFTFMPRNEKHAAEQLIGKTIIELPEAQAINRALSKGQSDAVYAELARRKIAYRPPWAPAVIDYLYRFIFIITANYPHVVPQLEGAENRRVLPCPLVPIREGKDQVATMIDWMSNGDRDKRLAAALRLVREGQFDNMRDDIENLMKRLGKSHAAGDEILEELLRRKLKNAAAEGMSLLEIKEKCMDGGTNNWHEDKIDTRHAAALTQNRMSRALDALGWRKVQKGRRKKRLWVPPDDWQEQCEEAAQETPPETS